MEKIVPITDMLEYILDIIVSKIGNFTLYKSTDIILSVRREMNYDNERKTNYVLDIKHSITPTGYKEIHKYAQTIKEVVKYIKDYGYLEKSRIINQRIIKRIEDTSP